VLDADELARRAVAPGSPALQRIVDNWGPGILLPSGELDRAAMRDVVFQDTAARTRLEQIVHPEVRRLREDDVRGAQSDGATIVVSDIPLLFEAGLENEFDVIVLVDSPEEERLRRLVEDRGLSEAEAARMIAAQWPAERKRERADLVIENRGSVSELERRAREVWRVLLTRAGNQPPGNAS
jgi:dephospho-CoA kinase